jgi:HEAT repeat protein
LGQLGEVGAIPYLIELLHDKDSEVRWQAVTEIGYFDYKPAVPILIQLLNDDDLQVRDRVAEMLGRLGDLRAVPALITVLQDNVEQVRQAAIVSLGKLGDLQAIPALIKIFMDEDEYTQQHILIALNTLNAGPSLIEMLKDNSLSKSAHKALTKMGKRAFSVLTKALNDQDIEIIGAVASILVQIDETGLRALRSNPTVVPLLIERLNKRSWDSKELIPVLEAIGTPEALAAVNQWRQERPKAGNIDP